MSRAAEPCIRHGVAASSACAMALSAVLAACGGQAAAVEPADEAGLPVQAGENEPHDGSAAEAIPTAESSSEGTDAEGSDGAANPDVVGAAAPGDTVVEPVVVPPPPALVRLRDALAQCPVPGEPVLIDLAWEPQGDEVDVLSLDLDGDTTSFGLLADYEGTSIIVRVRDADGNSVAVVKTTSSNTRVDAEIYAWRLAHLLGFGTLVAPVAPVVLDGPALEKLRDVLDAVTYDDEYKEANRGRVVRTLDAAIADGGAYVGAIKPWLGAFMFVGALGERERLGAHDVMEHLHADSAQPDDTRVTLQQFTRLYSPAGTHSGTLTMRELAADVSNLLLLDALMGQNDRFAGANVHFASVDGQRTETGERRGLPTFDLGAVRLLALDNGAALRGDNGTGIVDLRGGIVSGTRVERFDSAVVDVVRGLGRHVLGRGCEAPTPADDIDAIWAFLGLDPGSDEAVRAQGYLEQALDYLDRVERNHGDDIWLDAAETPALPTSEASTDGSGEAPAEAVAVP